MHKNDNLLICMFFLFSISYSKPITTKEIKNPFVNKDSIKNNSIQAYKEESAISVIVDDFQVNENTGLYGAEQVHPTLAVDGSGNFIIAWLDTRNGDKDIYAQRYGCDRIAQGANFRVNDDDGIAVQDHPAVAVDNSGNFIITWEDNRNGNNDIFAQRYTSNGEIIGSNFQVNHDIENEAQRLPAIAMNGEGKFVITWDQEYNTDYDIYAQQYKSDGTVDGNNFLVNDEGIWAWQRCPAVAMSDSGNYVITWCDGRNGSSDVYFQLFSSNGLPMGTNYQVKEEIGYHNQGLPAIAIDGAGNFIITWDGFYENDGDVFARRFNSTGEAIGADFQINDNSTNAWQGYPSIAACDSGNFLITWIDDRDGDIGVYAQRFDNSSIALGLNFRINDFNDNVWSYHSWVVTRVAVSDSGNFIISWEEQSNGDSDIFAQYYNKNGIAEDNVILVNEDNGYENQGFPAIAVDGFNNYLITWEDERNGDNDYDIYAQWYNSKNVKQGNNFRVNDDNGKSGQRKPTVAADKAGNFVITWQDERIGAGGIYAQRYKYTGVAVGDNFMVNDGSNSGYGQTPSIAMDGTGNFIITWYKEGYDVSGIYARRFNRFGAALGPEFRVNDTNEKEYNSAPAVAMDSLGNFVITWEKEKDYDFHIYAQRYNCNGEAIGTNFKVSESDGYALNLYTAIEINREGNFIISWQDSRNQNGDIYAQIYNSNGDPLGSNFRVNDDTGSASHTLPDIATDNTGNLIITWTDYRNGFDGDIYAQLFTVNGEKIGANFRINTEVGKYQSYSAVKLINGRIYNTWTSNLTGGTGYNIWANVLNWDNPVNSVEANSGKGNVADNYRLGQNYPNPFNPVTTIEYQLPKDSEVWLCIYNITGALIKTVLMDKQNAGSYHIQWDCRDNSGKSVAGGVYLYQLKTDDFVQCNKMVLLR